MSNKAEAVNFPFHHGRLALSFAGTVGDRGSTSTERVGSPPVLGEWLRAAGLLREAAIPTASKYRRALLLREAIARAVQALISARRPALADIAVINAIAQRWGSRPSLDPRTLRLLTGSGDPVEAAIGRIALDAIEMLSNPEERERLRACSLDSCGALFLTPAGRRERRWCAMARCGNRAKVAKFRERAS